MEADKSNWGKDGRRIAIELAISEMAACKVANYQYDKAKLLIGSANNILEYINNGTIPAQDD